MASLLNKKNLFPFILITSLFFLWGFARSILDVLNKHFQNTLHISISDSTKIQGMTYLGYFLMALPSGIVISRYGYRAGIVGGLGLMAIGCFIFIPGAALTSFNVFLLALFMIGCGLAMLETSANPYATELGPPQTASSRLNLAQAFNGMGCIIGPVLAGTILFKDHHTSIDIPYSIIGVLALLIGLTFCKVKLPEVPGSPPDSPHPNVGKGIAAVWKVPGFRLGFIALFCYEIAEISINSLFINYACSDNWLSPVMAAKILSFGALGVFMLARIIGSWAMSQIAATRVLLFCASGTLLGALLVVADLGTLSKCGLFACYAFEAVMFPTIFALTLSRVGNNVKIGSSFLMMTPIGGAVGTMLMGSIADHISLSSSFLVPAAGFAVILLYASFLDRKRIVEEATLKINSSSTTNSDNG